MQYKKLGRYELLRVLGKGAMGVVYEGRDPNLDRRVAIKTIMVDDLGPDAAAEYEARFRIEARSAARLQHPNIVTVYDSDRHGDTAYLVMEFIQGEDLKHHLDRGLRPTPEQALHLICDLLAALDFAHRQGVVHRDIKPANLLIEADGRVKLTDFGVARISGEATRTQGSMIGTLKYMAPEQVQGLKVDTRADLFSAGVVAYQLLAGVRPFEGDNDFTIIHQIIGQAPALPSTLQPGLPPGTDDILLRALAKNRDDRYQTAGEFSAALQAAFGTIVAGLTTQPGRSVPGFAAAIAAGATTSFTVPPPIVPVPTLPGTGINQELELEYWRAVRDSTDPKELEGFLARFPQGIYADLARRRLQRLAAAPDPDQTVLQGMTRPPGGTVAGLPQTAAAFDEGPTRDPTIPIGRGAMPPLPVPSAPAPLPARDLPPAAASAHLPPAPPSASTAPASGARPAASPGPAPRKIPVAAIAAVGVVVVAAAAWFATRPSTDAASTAASAQQDTGGTAAAVGVSAATAASAPAATAASSAAQPAVAAVAAASAPARATATAASKPAAHTVARKAATPAPASTRTAAVSSQPAPPPPPPRSEPVPVARTEPAVTKPVAPRLVSPAETCKDHGFLAKPICLLSECGKPEFTALPLCVRLHQEQRQKQLEAERAQQTR